MTTEEHKRLNELCNQFEIHLGYDAGESGHFSTAIKRYQISEHQFVTLSATGLNDLIAVERLIELIGRVKVEQ